MNIITQALNGECVKNGRVVTWLFVLLMLAGSIAYVWEIHKQRNELLQTNQQLADMVIKQQRVIDLMTIQTQHNNPLNIYQHD